MNVLGSVRLSYKIYVFYQLALFFSHNKSANIIFSSVGFYNFVFNLFLPPHQIQYNNFFFFFFFFFLHITMSS